jgi:hypothetical protein
MLSLLISISIAFGKFFGKQETSIAVTNWLRIAPRRIASLSSSPIKCNGMLVTISLFILIRKKSTWVTRFLAGWVMIRLKIKILQVLKRAFLHKFDLATTYIHTKKSDGN